MEVEILNETKTSSIRSSVILNFAIGTKMNQLADQYQFIVVYPQQLNVDKQSLCWNWFEISNQVRGHGEPAIIAGIVHAVVQNTSEWTVDKNRMYVAGFSAGAAMAVILGATYSDIFAAIGVHSGLEYRAATSTIDSLKVMSQGGPDPRRQGLAAFDAMGLIPRVIPTIVFQGTSDQVTKQWMQTDQLASNGMYNADFGNPSNSRHGGIPGGHSFTVFGWNDGQGEELQEYWKIGGMGHAWSGGSIGQFDTDPLGPNASLSMLQFFMNHSLSNYVVRNVNAS